jgi:putative flippase GtrA
MNFVVNRRWVFPDGGRRRFGTAAVRYGVLVVALLALNYTVLAVLTGLGLALLPAKLLTEIALVLISYRAQRTAVFGSARRSPADRASLAVAQGIRLRESTRAGCG